MWNDGQARVNGTAKTRTVLIAEDDELLRATLHEIVGTEGYAVLEATNGDEALEIIRRQPIDVLIADLHMPGKDGVALVSEIDAVRPAVIIFSAFSLYSPEKVNEQIGSRVFRTLRKPSPPRDLLTAVAEAISSLDQPP